MSKDWTPKQRQAIDSRDKTLLISAAAGSGKTATLTERIVRKLTDEKNPASLSRMLIVTFTTLSAGDLRRKISSAISDELLKDPTNKHLSKQLILLESSSICTIDSFFLDIVKSNFQRLGLPSNFRLADKGEIALLNKEIMNNIIEKYYDMPTVDESFLNFVEHFTSAKQSDALPDVFLDLHNKISSRIEGIDILLSLADELKNESNGNFFESRQGKIIHSYVLSGAKNYYDVLEYCCDVISNHEKASEKYLPSFASDKKFYSDLITTLENVDYTSARNLAINFTPKGLDSLKEKTDEIIRCKDLRKKVKEFATDIAKKYFALDEDSIKQAMLQTREVILTLYNILKEFNEASMEEKIKRKTFEFSDIKRFAYQVLINEDGSANDIALAYREKYDEIYIDEYQDVDAMQDKIFSLIAKSNNRFMVGDIKQSVYNFRGADSEVFSRYKKSFPLFENAENSDNALIFMSNNFRCDDNIIKFTNKIFSFVFGHCGESIEYTPNDDLIFSKKEPERTLPSPLVQIAVITADKSKSKDDTQKSDISPEAIWIANEINNLLKNGKKADDTPIEPRDIAIIMRTTTQAPQIASALAHYGIPFSDNSKYNLFETPDVLLAISILSAINNPHKDISLVAALYSPIFGYTMDELIEIRHSSDESLSMFEAIKSYSGNNENILSKNKYFLSKLIEYRHKSKSMPIDKLLSYIYRDLSLLSFESVDSQNLTKLYEMARNFESGSFKGLNNFISYINELIADDKVPSLSKEDGNNNTVKMVTAHKSKGLEYPVCFIYNTQHSFTDKDTKNSLLYHGNAGAALRLAFSGGLVNLNTPLREAICLEITNSQIEEEMRILYVALTRARERLYITAKTQSKLDKLTFNASAIRQFASDFRIKQCRDWISMILASIYPLEDGSSYTFTAMNKDSVSFTDEENNDYVGEIVDLPTISKEEIQTIKERFDFKYPYAHLNSLPSKLSVSKLTPTVLDDIDNDTQTLESFDEAKILEIEEFLENKSKVSSADRGTATHLFLQFCNFENAEENGVECELERLVNNSFIASHIADLINKKQLERFFKSNFYKSLKNATKTYREQRFNILLPASHFTQNEELLSNLDKEEILVQGVIDLFFEDENGNIILCDYKTDYLTQEELDSEELVIEKMKNRHGRQLEYYAMAIERFLGKRPDKILIYSLPFGEAVEIKL